MPTDLHELLDSAAAAPPAFDADAVVDRGLRQRRVRTWSRAGAAILLLVVAAAALILSLPQPRIVDLAGRPSAPAWPLALRYEEVVREGGSVRTTTGEFAGNSWNDWITVTTGEDGMLYVTRWGPEGRYGFGKAPMPAETAPFSWLAAANAVTLRPDDSQPPSETMSPSALLGLRFGDHPEQRDDRVILDDDLPALRRSVADRLGLAADALEAVRYEHDSCAASCGVQRHTHVWLPSLNLPLYVHEVDPDGTRSSLEVTHLQNGLAPPASLLPTPAPFPPHVPDIPPAGADGLSYADPYVEFAIDRGTWVGFTVGNIGTEPSRTPKHFALERWNGERWDSVASAPTHEWAEADTPLPPGKSRRVEVPLPDDADPGWHRLVIVGKDFQTGRIHQFHYTGDPNQ